MQIVSKCLLNNMQATKNWNLKFLKGILMNYTPEECSLYIYEECSSKKVCEQFTKY